VVAGFGLRSMSSRMCSSTVSMTGPPLLLRSSCSQYGSDMMRPEIAVTQAYTQSSHDSSSFFGVGLAPSPSSGWMNESADSHSFSVILTCSMDRAASRSRSRRSLSVGTGGLYRRLRDVILIHLPKSCYQPSTVLGVNRV